MSNYCKFKKQTKTMSTSLSQWFYFRCMMLCFQAGKSSAWRRLLSRDAMMTLTPWCHRDCMCCWPPEDIMFGYIRGHYVLYAAFTRWCCGCSSIPLYIVSILLRVSILVNRRSCLGCMFDPLTSLYCSTSMRIVWVHRSTSESVEELITTGVFCVQPPGTIQKIPI